MDNYRDHLLILNELSADLAHNALNKVGEKLRTTAIKHKDLINKRYRLSHNFRNYYRNKEAGFQRPAEGASKRLHKSYYKGIDYHGY